jgi:hypothetical protein
MEMTQGQAPSLKARHQSCMDQHAEPSRVRLHRAISWIARAEAETNDIDARFIFLWIAFNAAYAREFGFEAPERERLRQYFQAIVAVDSEGALRQALFGQFTGPIRTLVENKFVFDPFWRALRDHDSSDRWETQFAASRKAAMQAVMAGDSVTVLAVVFDRLYVLRNQLVHGGATWNSKVNRAQLQDGAAILHVLVPAMVELMLSHPELEFGPILYPVI